jgi:hypothetical protein
MARRDRSQTLRWLREGTERRKERRWRRKRTYVVIFGGMLAMLLLALPSMVIMTPLAHRIIDSHVAPYGWKLQVKQIRFGWITPLRLSGIDAVGDSGKTILVADSVDAPITILDILRGRVDLGTIHVDAPRVETTVYRGGSYLEDDIALLMESDSSESSFLATIEVRDAVLKVIDQDSGAAWRADQLQGTIAVGVETTTIQVEGVVTDPDGISGAVNSALALPNDDAAIAVSIRSDGLPLSLFDLAVIRYPAAAAALPQVWSGNATGKLDLSVRNDGGFNIAAESLDLRNLVVRDASLTKDQTWKLGRALLTGVANREGNTLRFEHFQLQTDGADFRANGLVDLTAIDRNQYLDAMLGDFTADLDLVSVTQSAPGLLPIRQDVTIQSGRIKAEVTGGYGQDQEFRSSWRLNSEPITAQIAGGQSIVLAPISADVILKPSVNWISAEKLLVTSSFGEATASGDLRGGQAQFNLDLERLATMLHSVLDIPTSSLGGTARGNLQWSVAENQQWNLRGSATANKLLVNLPGISEFSRPTLDLTITGNGRWGNAGLERLDQATLRLAEPGQDWNLTLAAPVPKPTSTSTYPLRIKGHGNLRTLASLVGDRLPSNLEWIEGAVQADVQCQVSTAGGSVTGADLILDRTLLVIDGQQYYQDAIKTQFTGSYRWPENILRAEQFSISSNAVSASIQGDLGPQVTRIEIAFRADLDRLARIRVQALPAPAPSGVSFAGQVEGNVGARDLPGGAMGITLATTIKDLAIQQPNAQGISQTLWREPSGNLQAKLQWNAKDQALAINQLAASSAWFTSELNGRATTGSNSTTGNLEGSADINTNILSDRITMLLGEPLRMTGNHQTPLRIDFARNGMGDQQFNILGSLGWDSAQVAGVTAGPARLPMRLSETSLEVQPASIPIQQGFVHLAGQVHYQDSPLWFEQRPGLFADSIKLNPDMCRTWLKYMVPIASDATDISGAFSMELTECKVIPSDPVRSRVAGALRVEGAAVGPGPLTRNVIATIDQIELAAKAIKGQTVSNTASAPKQWVQVDPQSVDFALASGQVSHQRLQMRIGKANLISSGSVSLDGRLNLRFQIPLESSWLGSDLAGLAGRQVTLPVGGTFAQPAIDNQALAGIVTQLGGQAIQSNAENYLQKQLDRQWQKLFGN